MSKSIEFSNQVVKEEYRKSGASLGLCKLVEFDSESDAVTLDIPVDGITIKGWTITPLMLPVVSSCVAVYTTLHQLHALLWLVTNLEIPSLASISGDQETGGQL